MNLLRLVSLFVIIYIVYSALKTLRHGTKEQAKSGQSGEPMVMDPQCQTYVPESAAVQKQGKLFCSEECAQKYLAR
jgi:hypothetical protein